MTSELWHVSKNAEFCIKTEECCIKTKEFCIKTEECCIKTEEFCIKTEEFCIKNMTNFAVHVQDDLQMSGGIPNI